MNTSTVTWQRRKVEQAYQMGGGTTTKQHSETFTTWGCKEYALRSVDGLFFLYIDGKQAPGRIFFDTLKAGKNTIEKALKG